MKYEVTKVKTGREMGINQRNVDIYIKYLQSCAVKSLDTMNTTYKTYSDNMKLFFQFLGNKYIISADTQKNFTEIWEKYSIFCLEKGNNKRTLANKRTACSTFFDWCLKRRLIKVNPFIYIDEIRINETDKRRESYFLSTQQIWEINYHMKNDTKHFDLQDRLLFNLFLDSGARISEIYNLKISQLDLEEMLFIDVRLKEGYIDSLIFFEETKILLKKWLEIRREKNIVNEYLFITYYNKRYNQMSKETIRSRIRKIGKIVGIDKFYPHSIRKSIINIVSNIGTIGDGSILANHKDSKVTSEHYIQQKRQIDMRNRIEDLRKKAGL